MTEYLRLEIYYIDQIGQKRIMRIANVNYLPIQELQVFLSRLIDGQLISFKYVQVGSGFTQNELRQLQEQRVKAKLSQGVPPPGIAPTDIEVGEVEYFQGGIWKKEI